MLSESRFVELCGLLPLAGCQQTLPQIQLCREILRIEALRIVKRPSGLVEISSQETDDSQKIRPAEGLGVKQVRSLVTDLRLPGPTVRVQHHAKLPIGGYIARVGDRGCVRRLKLRAECQRVCVKTQAWQVRQLRRLVRRVRWPHAPREGER